jgi:hypothetical protein
MPVEFIIGNPVVTQAIRTLALQRGVNPKDTRNDFKGKIPESERDPELYKSSLGTPVMANLIFDAVTYTDFNTKQQITTPRMQFDTVLLTVDRPKRVVKTEIQGRNGTVKEYIGFDDYGVTINIIIPGSNGRYPVEEVLALWKVLDAPVAIPVISNYLNNLGVYYLVLESPTMPQEAGRYSQQPITIKAVSDYPLVIQAL